MSTSITTPLLYNGYNSHNFSPSLLYAFDSTVTGVDKAGAAYSGAYRAMKTSEFAGGGGGGGGDASAANQTTQIGQLNNIIGKLGSGIAVSGISIDSINVNLDQVEALIGTSNSYLFEVNPATGVPTTATGTLASGSSTTVFSASATRKYLIYQNNSPVDHYINFGSAATSGNGIKVAAGGSYENPSHWYPRGSVNSIAYGAGAYYTAKEI